ncbi:MAG: hypothetical protein EXR77_08500 [Myxococcales bacterium]|nr:hypothetical protein [Myxococcales bacterium]
MTAEQGEAMNCVRQTVKTFSLLTVAGLAVAQLGCATDEAVMSASGQAAADSTAAAEVAVAIDAVAPIDSAASDGVTTVADVALDDVTVAVDAGAAIDTADAVKPCAQDRCWIDGLCLANLTLHLQNPCLWCLVAADRQMWTANDGGGDGTGKCDDNDPCSSADHCNAGACAGSGKICSDGNPCTDDACDKAKGCAFAANVNPCTDNNACTIGDLCKASACSPGGVAPNCDDGNSCTADSCLAVPQLGTDKVWHQGCTHLPMAATTNCDDGNACTSQDGCQLGLCAAGTATNCDDSDVCTVDSCAAQTGCAHKAIANLCTDSNLCTDQGCDAKKGCVFPFNTLPCDDNSLCTASDTCKGGACIGSAIAFADANTCTDDSCDPKIGAVHTANSLPCNDNNACTLEDTCGASACQAGSKPLACDDGNVCTSDSCDAAKGCQLANNTTSCNDDNACTSGDTCGDAKCVGNTISCDDSNACTADSCDVKAGCKHALVVSNACRPVIDISYPPRAATINSKNNVVTVKGSVKSGAGAITSFVLNGVAVPVGADGSFASNVAAKPGGNTLVFDATDKMGSKKRRVQAFLWSTVFFKPDPKVAGSGMIDEGLAFWLSQQVIDDGDHALPANDLATIFEIYLQTLNIASLLPTPLYSGSGFTVTASNLKYDPAKVTLKSAATDVLKLTAKIANVTADLDAKGPLGIKSTGKLKIASIDIVSEVQLSVDPTTHMLIVKSLNSLATINGLVISNFSGLFGSLINSLIPTVTGSLKPQLEKQLNDAMAKQIEPALASALNALALNTSFEITKLDGSGGKVKLTLQSDFNDVDGDAAGLAFIERGRVTAIKATPYDNLGVPGRILCGTGVQKIMVLKQKPLELTIADDAFNQLLHGTWYGGLFEFPVPATLLGNIDLSQYGVSDLTMKVSAMLAPTMDDCNAKTELMAHIGDFKVDAKLKLFGKPMDVVIYATFTAGIEIKASNAAIGISLTEIKTSAIQVDVVQDDMVSSEGVLEKLVADNLLGNLVAKLGGDALGSFPLPKIDLSAALPTLPPGTGIAIAPEVVTRKLGNSIVGGKLK